MTKRGKQNKKADDEELLDEENVADLITGIVNTTPVYPGGFSGRGIVICAGGTRYFTNAYVCIRMLRRMGCELPIQVWHLGKGEMSRKMISVLLKLRIEHVDALAFRKKYPARILKGWELKCYALIHCPFKEVLLLDADNTPLINPEILFEGAEFKEHGALFWPDRWPMSNPAIWEMCGLSAELSSENEFESGQILVDKSRCWAALNLAMWMNEYSDFFYRYVHGDKETFHLAFRRLGKDYRMTTFPVEELAHTLCQHDFKGKRIFQHRIGDKWSLYGHNRKIKGFLFEDDCKAYVKELRKIWDGFMWNVPRFDPSINSERERIAAESVVGIKFEYNRIGFDRRELSFLPDGTLGVGGADLEVFWDLCFKKDTATLIISSESEITCVLTRELNGAWKGRWERFERMFVELTPIIQAKVPQPALKLFRGNKTARKATRKTITLRAPANSFTGYGLHTCRMLRDLSALGYRPQLLPTSVDETIAPLSEDIKALMVEGDIEMECELVLHPPDFEPSAERRTVWFTMWETTALAKHHVDQLNRAECVIVPTAWNASCFSACGVTKPIRIVPLGIDTNVFRYAEMQMEGNCVFGTGARLDSGKSRKRLDQVIDAFVKAFPDESQVELQIKCFPDCDISKPADPRITLIQEYRTDRDLAVWFQGLTCFVSAARGEGWGLMQHQALATGRPVIASRFGGVAEFLNSANGYPVDYVLTPAEGRFTGIGYWATSCTKSMIRHMRSVFRDRVEARERGRAGVSSVRQYSWLKSHKALVKVLKEFSVIT
ncbi:MAG: hypothetical protein P4L99_05855 [Chthoniobacter sp.]|nr:hypothetical protein [Chthoniobacter sp.]